MRADSKRVGLVQDDYLMHARGHVDFLVSEALDLFSDNLDASLIRCVHLEDSRLDGLS